MEGRLQIPHATNKRQIIQWANEQMQVGVSRQSICDALLRHDNCELNELEARSTAWQDLSSVMLNRNLDGIECERQGRIERAIALYEANLTDEFEGSHPYERLRIIYTKRQDYINAIRVCQAFIDLPSSAYKRSTFQAHLDKLQIKQAAVQKKSATKPQKHSKGPTTEIVFERFPHEQGIPVKWIEGNKASQSGKKTLFVSNRGEPITELSPNEWTVS